MKNTITTLFLLSTILNLLTAQHYIPGPEELKLVGIQPEYTTYFYDESMAGDYREYSFGSQKIMIAQDQSMYQLVFQGLPSRDPSVLFKFDLATGDTIWVSSLDKNPSEEYYIFGSNMRERNDGNIEVLGVRIPRRPADNIFGPPLGEAIRVVIDANSGEKIDFDWVNTLEPNGTWAGNLGGSYSQAFCFGEDERYAHTMVTDGWDSISFRLVFTDSDFGATDTTFIEPGDMEFVREEGAGTGTALSLPLQIEADKAILPMSYGWLNSPNRRCELLWITKTGIVEQRLDLTEQLGYPTLIDIQPFGEIGYLVSGRYYFVQVGPNPQFTSFAVISKQGEVLGYARDLSVSGERLRQGNFTYLDDETVLCFASTQDGSEMKAFTFSLNGQLKEEIGAWVGERERLVVTPMALRVVDDKVLVNTRSSLDTTIVGPIITTNSAGNWTHLVSFNKEDLGLTKTVSTKERSVTPSLNLSPNPTSGLLNIKSDTPLVGPLRLFNATGQVIEVRQLRGEQDVQLSTTGLPIGTYMIQVMTDSNALITRRFVKQ